LNAQADRAAQLRWLSALLGSYFAFVGTHSPYLSLYFADQGLSVTQIGFLMTLPQALRIITPLFWGWWADRLERPILLLRASLCILVVCCLLVFKAQGFWTWACLLGVMFLFSSATFGRARVWGSIGFIFAVVCVGYLLETYGLKLLPWCMLIFALAALGTVLGMRSRSSAHSVQEQGSLLALLQRPGMAWFLASAFFMIFAHAALYTLYSLHLEKLGLSRTVIGLLWGLGVLAEIALFWWQAPLFKRFRLGSLLRICFVLAALRFLIIGLSGANLAWLALAQLFHAISFAVHHSASMQTLTVLAHSEVPQLRVGKAKAVALYTTVAYGVGASVGGLSHAWIWQALGPEWIFHIAAISCLLGALCALNLKRLE
jgi:MFS transporter, PPP family, 3-phenylpropionic acid transporter